MEGSKRINNDTPTKNIVPLADHINNKDNRKK